METTDKNEIKTIVNEALGDLTKEVKTIKETISTPKYHSETNNLIGGSIIVFSIILILILNRFKFRDGSRSEEKINLYFVIFWFVLFLLLIGAIYFLGYIRLPKTEFLISEEDIFIILVSIVAIVGAIWAILARIDAEKAFNKSKEILAVLGDTFPLYDIVNNGKASPILDAIGTNDCSVSLFIGFPCIGYLYTDKDKLNVKPDILFNNLKYGIERIITKINNQELANFDFSLSAFSKTDTLLILGKYNTRYPEKSIDSLKDQIDQFYDRANYLKGLTLPDNVSIKIDFTMRPDENLRFISLKKSKPNTPMAENKVIVWIVKNLMYDDVSFDSSCFQTSDPKLITIVQSAFDNNNSPNGSYDSRGVPSSSGTLSTITHNSQAAAKTPSDSKS